MTSLDRCTAAELGRLIVSKQASAVEIAQACLVRITARDQEVQAWEHVDPESVLAQARARDRTPPRGPLHGIPFGVKDVIDTHDCPTQYGSPIYSGHRPRTDAAAVALLREAGAVLLGKTVTVELAGFHWSRTRNPHDLAHTPGGSSSGSGAAVADFMTPLALGTQTGGSTLRPAAFCGVMGYKPSFNLVNRAGMKPLAESQDTLGLFARSLEDLALMLAVLTGCAQPPLAMSVAPRIAIARMPVWPALDSSMARAFEEACARLARAGASVDELELAQPFVAAFTAQREVNDYEAWRGLAHERVHHWQQLSSSLQARLTQAARCTYEQYRRAQDVIFQCRALLRRELFTRYDVLLTPSTPGEAPRSHENTGDSSFHRIWTTLHTPALHLPVFRGSNGLPMGLQLIGPYRGDAALLAHAGWIERALSA
jgi:Asp-tRNA(Asn)/Glu-tRNA(Gln) amidotransferase A subunit family amidase